MAQNQTSIVILGDADGSLKAVSALREELASFASESDKARQSTNALARSNDSNAGSFEKIKRVAGGTQTAITAVATAWSGLSNIINAQIIRDNQALADAIDVSVTSLMEWQNASKYVGIDAKKMGDILTASSQSIGEFARTGGGNAAKLLKELGFHTKDFIGLKADEQLLKVGLAISELESRGEQVSAIETIAKGSARLLPLLDQNATKLREFMEQANQSGFAMSEQDAATVTEYANAWESVTTSLSGVQNRLTLLAANTGTDALNGLASTIRDNADMVQYLDEALQVLAAGAIGGSITALVKKRAAAVAAAKADMELARETISTASAAKAEARANLIAAGSAKERSIWAGRLKNEQTKLLDAHESGIGAARRYNQVTTVVGQASLVAGRGIAAFRTALSILGGPAGIALMAGTALAEYAANLDTAKVRSQESIGPIDQLALSLRELYDVFSGEADNKRLAVSIERLSKNSPEKLQEMIAAKKTAISDLEKVEKPDWWDGIFDGKYDTAQESLIWQRKDLVALEQAYVRVTQAKKEDSAESGNGEEKINKLTEAEKKLQAQIQGVTLKYASQRPKIEILREEQEVLQEVIKKGNGDVEQHKKLLALVNTELEKEKKALSEKVDVNQEVLDQLEYELELLNKSPKERAQDIALRRLDANATDKQREAVIKASDALFEQKEQLQNVAKATVEARQEIDPFTKAWDDTAKEVEEAFADAWKGSFDSFDDFSDQILSSFKNMLATMAHEAITKPILLNVQAAVGSAFGLSGNKGGQGVQASGFDITSLSNLSSAGSAVLDLFNPSNGSVLTSGFNNFAFSATGQQLGLSTVGNPELVRFMGSGQAPQLTSLGQGASQAVGGLGAGFSAYQFAQKGGFAGGMLGGTATTALAGGLSGAMAGTGFMAGASTALTTLGPVGWAMMAIGAILGSKKPSDKTQWAGFTGSDNYIYAGGADGKKFSQENRDAATQVANALSAFDTSLDRYSGVTSDTSYQVTVGSRDGIKIKADSTVTNRADLGLTPNGSENITGDYSVYGGSDLQSAMDAAFEHMASQAGVMLDVYKVLTDEGEILAATYERVHMQLDEVVGSSEMLGLQFAVTNENGLQLADQLIDAAGGLSAFNAQNVAYYDAFFTAAEKQQYAFDTHFEAVDELNDKLTESGYSAVQTKEEFRTLLESLDLTTEAGAATRTTMMEYGGSVAALDAVILAATESGSSGVETFYDLQQASESLTDTISRISLEFGYVSDVTDQLGHQWALTGDAGLAAADDLVQSAGGFSQFQSDMGYAINSLYSEEERVAMARAKATDYLATLNEQLGLTGESALDSHAELRQYLDTRELSNKAERDAYATALKMAGAIDTLNGSLEDSIGWNSLEESDQQYITERAQLIADHHQEELAKLNEHYDAQISLANKQYEIARKFAHEVEQLQLSSLSPLTPQQRLAEARRQWEALRDRAHSGDVAALEQLSGAGQTWVSESQSVYGSGEESVNAFDQVSAELAALGDTLGNEELHKRRVEELEHQQLDAQNRLEEQTRLQLNQLALTYNVLADIQADMNSLPNLLAELPENIANVLNDVVPDTGSSTGQASVPPGNEAFIADIYSTVLRRQADQAGLDYWESRLDAGVMTRDQLRETLIAAAEENGETIHGSHRNGLPLVPFDGYRAETHVGEMIVPAHTSNFLRSAGVSVGPAIDTQAMETELRNMSRQITDLNRIIANLMSEQIDATERQTGALTTELKNKSRPAVLIR